MLHCIANTDESCSFQAISNICGIRLMSFESVFQSQFDNAADRTLDAGLRGAFIESCTYGEELRGHCGLESIVTLGKADSRNEFGTLLGRGIVVQRLLSPVDLAAGRTHPPRFPAAASVLNFEQK